MPKAIVLSEQGGADVLKVEDVASECGVSVKQLTKKMTHR